MRFLVHRRFQNAGRPGKPLWIFYFPKGVSRNLDEGTVQFLYSLSIRENP